MTTVAITTIHSVFISGLLSWATYPSGPRTCILSSIGRGPSDTAMQMHQSLLRSKPTQGRRGPRRRPRPGSDRDGDQSAGRGSGVLVCARRDGGGRGRLRRLGLHGRPFRDLVAGDALDDRVDLLAVEGLLLEQHLRDLFERGAWCVSGV